MYNETNHNNASSEEETAQDLIREAQEQERFEELAGKTNEEIEGDGNDVALDSEGGVHTVEKNS